MTAGALDGALVHEIVLAGVDEDRGVGVGDVKPREHRRGFLRPEEVLGLDPADPGAVSQVVGQSLPWTLVLVGLATTFTFILGMVLGTLAGWKRGTWLDSLIPATTILQAVPVD